MSKWDKATCKVGPVSLVSRGDLSSVFEFGDTSRIEVPRSVEVSFDEESGALVIRRWWAKYKRLSVVSGASKRMSTRATVKRHEKDAAVMLRARGHAHARPGSGAHPLGKGDAVGAKDLGECKQTEKKSISIKQSWLAKIENEARGEGKKPFLHVRWLKPIEIGMSPEWVMIPAYWFEDLLEQYEC